MSAGPSRREIRVHAGGERLVAELADAVRSLPPGGILTVQGAEAGAAADLEKWARLTGHLVVGRRISEGGLMNASIRKSGGHDPWPDALRALDPPGFERRLWIYTNFDCNLACDYCCVRSSPKAERRALDLDAVATLAREARDADIRRILVTGGEPFLLPDIGPKVLACARELPVTVLTNAMLFTGPRRSALASLPRDRVTLQVSLDSPSPAVHDSRRGAGSWERARSGMAVARELGFRVRVAATIGSSSERNAMDAFLAREGVPTADRVIRPIALRGTADEGLPLARSEVEPEPTVTAGGLYWHPVGADDDDFLVTREPLPLARALAELERLRREDADAGARIAGVFRCA